VSSRPLRLLTIAGSDSSGGAGLQADLRTFETFGVWGSSAATAVTAQTFEGVRGVWAVPAAALDAQIVAAIEGVGVDGVKIGMLRDEEQVEIVGARLEGLTRRVPVVLDPVLAASDGTPLLLERALETLRRRLVPLSTLLTPNRAEALRLVPGCDDPEAAAERLATLGPSVLVTGGDGSGGSVRDVLVGGGTRRAFEAPRIQSGARHGTGCVLSAAALCGLARGASIEDAVAAAIAHVRACLDPGRALGAGVIAVAVPPRAP